MDIIDLIRQIARLSMSIGFQWCGHELFRLDYTMGSVYHRFGHRQPYRNVDMSTAV